MQLVLKGEPNERQKEFFLSTSRHIAYGGARGGGKSWALRRKFVLLALRYPKLRLLLLRRTFPELRENHILPLQFELNGVAKWKETEKTFVFPNGSRLKLGYCDNEKDLLQYQGHEYDVIGLEEATHFLESQMSFFTTCNRNTRADFKPRMYYTSNPGSRGHQWFKRLFVDRNFRNKEKPENYVFIPAKVFDNHVLMKNNPEYVEALENLPEQLRKAHLDGDWNIFDGQVFTEFTNNPEGYYTRRNTHVIAPFEIPSTWRRFRSFDFGYSRPFAVQWWAVDTDGVAYMYRQWYGSNGQENVGLKLEPRELAKKIKEIEDTHERGNYIKGIADPSIWDASRGESIAEQMQQMGIYFEPGDNKRLPGKMQVHYRLKFDENGFPRMYIFNTCKDVIRTLPLLQYDEKKFEDVNTDMEDHDFDCLKYFCMANPLPSTAPSEYIPKQHNPLETDEPVRVFGFMNA